MSAASASTATSDRQAFDEDEIQTPASERAFSYAAQVLSGKSCTIIYAFVRTFLPEQR